MYHFTAMDVYPTLSKLIQIFGILSGSKLFYK